MRCLRQLAYEFQTKFPIASNIILRDFYVNNLITGFNSVQDAVTYCQQVATILRSAQFNLRKWNSNNPNIIKHLQVEDEPFSTLTLGDKEGSKTLGIVWNSRLDIITYPIPKLLPSQTISKRNILSDISKIYDPLGLVSPCVVLAKILIQKLWSANLDWDENVSPDLAERWLHFRSMLGPTCHHVVEWYMCDMCDPVETK
ncbi:hypothetical protein ILUMI_22342 [Ignelater luminosus]|uniref:Uncharacterized protein n=1 Tax=Ignelater luminosus TaxID=2038154 RepID=A0A8K0CHB5_IGNLU|nr:hypothetical protein ILUMI_22342 [Ignelater luminosus]